MNIKIMISRDTGLKENQVAAVLDLLEQGSTVPFIARYRKERTGSLDEVAISGIRDRAKALKELQARKQAIIKSLEERQLYTKDLAQLIQTADSMTRLEDVYEKYRPKRRTRATIAREKGLEPLARMILEPKTGIDLQKEAAGFIGPDVESLEAAWAGARDIIAEWVNENQRSRKTVRYHFDRSAKISAKVVKAKEQEAEKYRDYFDFSERLKKCPGHRILAMRRGEQEGFLKLSVEPDTPRVLHDLGEQYVKNPYDVGQQVEEVGGGLLKGEAELVIVNRCHADVGKVEFTAVKSSCVFQGE